MPELNKSVISPERFFEVFRQKQIEFYELPLEDDGCYVHRDGKDYVFLRSAMRFVLYHRTLCYEGSHALCHHPAPFLLWRHNLEAEVLSLICLMPLPDLPRLNKVKHQLDDESFELLQRRNLANERWKL